MPMMKNKLTLVLAATAAAFAGCQDELIETGNEKTTEAVANEVIFGPAEAPSFADNDTPESRTAYGQGYAQDGKWYCDIDWVYGDEVRVYCAQATSPAKKSADYRIVWDGGQKGDVYAEEGPAAMEKTGEPLIWGNENVEHTFYAFYPASLVQETANPEKGVIKGSIPNTQTISWTQDAEGNWAGAPDMKYAFMRAEETVAAENVGEPVTLHFKPLTTAVQIVVTAAETMNEPALLSSINILAQDKAGTRRQAVCGDFEMDLSTGTVTLGANDQTNNYQITVDARQKDSEGNLQPIEVVPGKSVSFTIFLLPGADDDGNRTLRDLQVRVPGFGVGSARISYNDGINIEVGTVNRLRLPGYTPGKGANRWMSGIDNDVQISQVSIPGSVNAFTRDILPNYSYSQGNEMDVTQWQSVTEQFNAGVRAFEVATERVGSIFPNRQDLGEADLTAGENEGSSFADAMQTLAGLVNDNPSEFVVVMPYYAPNSTENVEAWINQLYNYLHSNPEINGIPVAPFDGITKMKDARGKILMLIRYAGDRTSLSAHLESGAYTDIFTKASIVFDWDLDRDRWYKRGYDVSNGSNWQQVSGKQQWQWTGDSNPGQGSYVHNNWAFEASLLRLGGAAAATTYHVYDWERVCQETRDYDHHWIATWVRNETHWYASIEEKKTGTEAFLRHAVQDLKGESSGDYMYIASLRGYYVTDNGVSALPYPPPASPDAGRHGNIPPYARDINQAIYNYILNTEYDDRGPLGIVLMNYAGTGTESGLAGMDMHGDDLLQAVIDNNFRFLLNTGGAE